LSKESILKFVVEVEMSTGATFNEVAHALELAAQEAGNKFRSMSHRKLESDGPFSLGETEHRMRHVVTSASFGSGEYKGNFPIDGTRKASVNATITDLSIGTALIHQFCPCPSNDD
jgi:hypothetical protein